MSNREHLPSAAPALRPGHLLGDKFEIRGVLGEGGTGIVYEARRVAEGDVVALKVIHPHLLGDAQVRGRFTREAAILRRLRGRHLCPIVDFGEIDDPRRPDATLLYIALPKIDGPALDRVVAEEGALAPDRATAIIAQVCHALSSAHAQGVIHRDLKPANVILRGAGHDEHAIVVDFGLAKIMTGGTGAGTTVLTVHNMVFGTPEYMAPEQARGDELDARCDVYAVGVMLYQLLTGVVPFTGATPLVVLTAHLTSEPVAPRLRAPDRPISRALEAVVLHALAKDPERRYPTAAAFAAAVAQAGVDPDDVEAVVPHAVVLVDDAVDGRAATIPSPFPSAHPRAAPLALAATLPVTGTPTPAPTGAPSRGSSPSSSSSRQSVTSVRFRRVEAGIGPRGWVLVWVVAGAIGIGVGVYLSLRVP